MKFRLQQLPFWYKISFFHLKLIKRDNFLLVNSITKLYIFLFIYDEIVERFCNILIEM